MRENVGDDAVTEVTIVFSVREKQMKKITLLTLAAITTAFISAVIAGNKHSGELTDITLINTTHSTIRAWFPAASTGYLVHPGSQPAHMQVSSAYLSLSSSSTNGKVFFKGFVCSRAILTVSSTSGSFVAEVNERNCY